MKKIYKNYTDKKLRNDIRKNIESRLRIPPVLGSGSDGILYYQDREGSWWSQKDSLSEWLEKPEDVKITSQNEIPVTPTITPEEKTARVRAAIVDSGYLPGLTNGDLETGVGDDWEIAMVAKKVLEDLDKPVEKLGTPKPIKEVVYVEVYTGLWEGMNFSNLMPRLSSWWKRRFGSPEERWEARLNESQGRSQ